jgi:hypothetical protein
MLLTTLLRPALHAAEDAEVLGAGLSKIYREWRAALLASSYTAWQKHTTTYRQALTRNLIVSQGQSYPEAIFAIPVTPPDTAGLKLLEVEANGPTAHLVYFGKVDIGLDEKDLPENLLVLKFFKEKGGWKFDSTRLINLGDVPEMRDDLKSGDMEFLKHAPFNPPGVLPAVPKPCGVPQRVAALRIHAVGFQVSSEFAGYDYSVVENNAEQQLLMGGLNWGKSTLKLKIKEVPLPVEDADKILSIEVVVLTGKEAKPVIRVFRWEPTTLPPPAAVELTVTLDNGTLKGL